MTLLRNGSKLINFVHIPKTGGSSIEFALRQAGAKRALHYHKKLNYVACNLQHMHAALYDIFIPEDFYDYGFCVTRHPFDRLLSEYKWRHGLGDAKKPFDVWVQNVIKAYASKEYVNDNHIRPQSQFVGKSSKIEVFRFEDGLNTVLQSAASALELTGVDLSTHRRSGETIQVKWSKMTRQLALEFYQSDFEKFNYDPSDHTANIKLARWGL